MIRERWIYFNKQDIDQTIDHVYSDLDDLIEELVGLYPLNQYEITGVRVIETADGKIQAISFKVEEDD